VYNNLDFTFWKFNPPTNLQFDKPNEWLE